MTDCANKANEDIEAIAANNAELDKLDKAGEVNEIVEAAEADEADKVNEYDKANEYDIANEADEVNEASALDEAVDAGFISFSLTKFSAIFGEVKEYFVANKSQLGLGLNVQIRLICRSNSCVQNWQQQWLWGHRNKINNQPMPAKFIA